ncbi:A1pp-domain-containing protein [Tricholoma matsutake]|nr:A1pp-domain-containing protein [Tricholoma matsutake 945]
MSRIADIPTLGQRYEGGDLKPSSSVHYPADKALLDKVSLLKGNITKLVVDAIVNAANSSLRGGGGVDGAIHQAAGWEELQTECAKVGHYCATGDSKITSGCRLPARYIIHTVGPSYDEDRDEEAAALLASCYESSLKLAVKHDLKHVAFPCISTGLYGYPPKAAARVALDTVRRFCESEEGAKLERVIFVVFNPPPGRREGESDDEIYRELIPEYFPTSAATDTRSRDT